MAKNIASDNRFVGLEMKKSIFNKLEFLREELGQSLSSLIREGINMLFDRYAATLNKMDE